MDLQLHRITRLVRDYHAVLPWKTIHVAGTNGKGTTAAFLTYFLHHIGIKVGRFNSPHLVHRHDCIVVNERTVDRDLFLETERLVKHRDAEAKLESTSFELLTATAFEIFARKKVQVAVVECGMGGRLDATNIFLPEEVLCSVITSISLDHQAMLGDTLEKIATEKAGIIKAGVPVVVDRHNQGSVLAILKARAAASGSPFAESTKSDEEPLTRLTNLSTSGAGQSSRENLAVATKVYQILAQYRKLDLPPITEQDLLQAVAYVQKFWKGRLQREDFRDLVGKKSAQYCLLDGAHNKEGATRLRAFVDQRATEESPRPLIWVLAISAGKDAGEIMSELIRDGDRVVVCEFGAVEGMPWVKPQPADDLAKIASTKTSKAVITRAGPAEALRAAVASAPDDADVVVGGSLYLVGQLLRELDEAHRQASAQ